MSRDFIFRIKPGQPLPAKDPNGFRVLLDESTRQLKLLGSDGDIVNVYSPSQSNGDYLPTTGGLMSGDIQMAAGAKILSESGNTNISLLNGYFLLETSSSIKGTDYNHRIQSSSGSISLTARDIVTNDQTEVLTSNGGFSVYYNWAGTGSTEFTMGESVTISSQQVVSIISNRLYIGGLPTFADNNAALAGGLSYNDVYKTATGELRIVVN